MVTIVLFQGVGIWGVTFTFSNVLIQSGLHIDGSEEAPIIEEEIVQQCHQIRKLGIEAVVISGVFSPIDEHFKQEHHVRTIIQRELPTVDVVCSSEVSNIGFLERENASILNASILKFAWKTIKGFRAAMKRLDLHCALYITQNDGTLIDAPSAAILPIRTFSSGPTNSMRGAAYLGLSDFSHSGKKASTIVVDVGGTTTVSILHDFEDSKLILIGRRRTTSIRISTPSLSIR